MRLLLAGAAGGFVWIFTSWLIIGALFHRYQRLTPETWRPEGPTQYALSSLVLVLGGAGTGLLYFLVGGLANLSEVGWAGRGLLFGGAVWLGVAAPIHVITAIYVRLHRGHVAGALLDSLVGLLLVGGACAFAAR
ncbi:MAG TPA: hypothetical protein VFK78_00890 [Gemmatimonadales bacterium]|nr:hypothetical protein [Gemmatimonadales bacterium]